MKKFLKIFLIMLLTVCIGVSFASCNDGQTDSDSCEHSYDNACDAICNGCGTERVVGDHVSSADDGDCTTDIKCSACGEVITAGKAQHEASADDGDCTTDEKCSVCEKVLTAGKTQHVANADDGDCTTAVTCANCDCVVIAAKAHNFTGTWQNDGTDHWHVCANNGCNVADTRAAHAEGTDGKCTDCGRIMNECTNHEYTITRYDDNGHWKECACGDKQAAVEHDLATEGDCTVGYHCNGCDWISPAKNHTPEADDGDCTTDVKCSVCGKVAIAGNNTHVPSTEGSCTEGFHCADSGCNWISPAKDHTPHADDGDCTTDIKCAVCGNTVVAGKKEHIDGNSDGVCDEKGCNKTGFGSSIGNGGANLEGGWGALIRP